MGFAQLTHRRAAGALVISPGSSHPFLLILDRHGRWTLPKGHLEPGESPVDAAVREVQEETGIYAVMVQRLPQVRYRFWESGLLIRKEVIYYLALAHRGSLKPDRSEVKDARWVGRDDPRWQCIYENLQQVRHRGHRLARRWLNERT